MKKRREWVERITDESFQKAEGTSSVNNNIQVTHLKVPSVLTLKSCRINQIPIIPSGSVNLNALTHKLPIKFRVNIPLGALLGSCVGGIMACAGLINGPCPACAPAVYTPVGVIGAPAGVV